MYSIVSWFWRNNQRRREGNDKDHTDTATLRTNKHTDDPDDERRILGLLLIPELQRKLLRRSILQLEI